MRSPASNESFGTRPSVNCSATRLRRARCATCRPARSPRAAPPFHKAPDVPAPHIIVNAVGLTPRLLFHAPRLSALAGAGWCRPFRETLPAVTCTAQATLLTGQPPFTADNLSALLFAIAHHPHPDLQALRPELPPMFQEIVNRALQKELPQRYRRATELAQDLRACLHSLAA